MPHVLREEELVSAGHGAVDPDDAPYVAARVRPLAGHVGRDPRGQGPGHDDREREVGQREQQVQPMNAEELGDVTAAWLTD